MPAAIEPAALAALVDFAERPRTEGWSLRAALTRYAQPEPQRVSDVLDLIRRIDAAVAEHAPLLERNGPEIWDALQADGAGANDAERLVLGLLRAMRELDRLGDALARWAVDRADPQPQADVDAVTADVTQRLADLGVPREERRRPPRRRG